MILLASSEAQEVIGFCQLYPSFCSVEAKPTYTLYDLFVSLQARRSGAGTVLLQAAEKLAAAHGKARKDLNTAYCENQQACPGRIRSTGLGPR